MNDYIFQFEKSNQVYFYNVSLYLWINNKKKNILHSDKNKMLLQNM